MVCDMCEHAGIMLLCIVHLNLYRRNEGRNPVRLVFWLVLEALGMLWPTSHVLTSTNWPALASRILTAASWHPIGRKSKSYTLPP